MESARDRLADKLRVPNRVLAVQGLAERGGISSFVYLCKALVATGKRSGQTRGQYQDEEVQGKCKDK